MARIVEDEAKSPSPASTKKSVKTAKKAPKGKAEKTPKGKTEKAPKSEKASKPEKAPKTVKKSPHRGRTTGLRLKQAWAKMFEENAKSSTGKRMTDDQIHKAMRSEFPEKKARTLRDVSGVYVARKRYNVGKFTKGVVPTTLSTAYDEKGKAVDGKPSKNGGGDEEGRRKGFHGKAGGRKSSSVRK